MRHIFVTFFLAAACCLLFLSGCGNQQKLGGQVVFSDGEPLKTGTIFFSKSDFLARAHIKQDGSYDVGSFGAKDGLPPGTYKVFITGALEAVEIQPKSDRPKIVNEMGETEAEQTEGFKSLVAQEFTSEETTPLTITVPGERVYNITVERPK